MVVKINYRGKKEGRSHHHHHHHHSKTSGGGDGQNNSSSSVLPEDLANRPIVQMFYGLSNELDQRHDKYERIVKLCRDITIESKRIIFHLHRIQKVEEEMSTLLEVEERLKKIRSTHWIQVAKELEGESPFQFLRAYTGGLQEYIEAVSFYHFLRYNELVFRETAEEQANDRYLSFENIDESMMNLSTTRHTASAMSLSFMGSDGKVAPLLWFPVGYRLTGFHYVTTLEENLLLWIKGNITDVQSDLIFEREEVFNDNALDVSSKEELGTKRKPLLVTVPRTDFILGIADLTGEVMRRVINSIGFGDTETCFKLTNFLHDVYYGFKLFDGLTLENRELRSKSYTMLNSLKKCEAACYTINLRGSEIPKHMFAEILYKNERDEVESLSRIQWTSLKIGFGQVVRDLIAPYRKKTYNEMK
ncbi:unnamed protein product [Lepeophtheirus salmonis]|uniref:(salmon louse) hypothetical protein n=1 Tax=Lepeophtheirus salmonis TaxID=72036 RepID=A0A7R8D3G6_LEPSM|nr:unnamed protein product [Lepeophtheirus salmonis]CAF3016800.1 unnamed protein product [Lepeophtheirus salmonis]